MVEERRPTPPSPEGVEDWLREARGGSKVALGRSLESIRPYLLLVANRELDPKLQSKEGASDLVQETFLEAQRDFGQFAGKTGDEWLGWVRAILLHNVANVERRYRKTGKRDPSREVSLADGETASGGPRFELAASSITPSKHAVRDEEEAALAQALARLSEEYRRAILLRNQQGMSFEAIGRELGRSAEAARKLWARAIEQLQQIFESTDGRSST